MQIGGGASFTGQPSILLTNQNIQAGAANAISFSVQAWLRNSHPRIDNITFDFVYDPNVFDVYSTQTAYKPSSLNPEDGTRITSLAMDGSGQYGYCQQGKQISIITPNGGHQKYPGCSVSVGANPWSVFGEGGVYQSRPSTANSQVASISFSVKPGYENHIRNMESKIELIKYGFNASSIGHYDVDNSDLWSEMVPGTHASLVPSCSTLSIKFPLVPNSNFKHHEKNTKGNSRENGNIREPSNKKPLQKKATTKEKKLVTRQQNQKR